MAVESSQDRLDLLSDFGVDATVDGVTVTGILDKEFRVVGNIESEYPVFECRSEDIPSIAHGQLVVYSGITYEVVGIEDDGEGLTALVLINQ